MENMTHGREFDLTNIGVLLGVVAASFVALGAIIYIAGDDQSSEIAAAYDAPMRTERMLRKRIVEPRFVDYRS